jgi:hypothetical protein
MSVEPSWCFFRGSRRIATLGALLIFVGCASNGPSRLTADRFDYTTAVADSFKEQNLMNLVRLRYADWPVFLNVQQIVAGYNFDVGGGLAASLNSPFGRGNDSAGANVSGRFTERPTITYSPLSGQDFFKNLMRPIRPSLLMGLVQAGWPVDVLLLLSADSIGEFHNSGISGGRNVAGDTEFFFIVDVLRELQEYNAIGIKYVEEKDEFESVLHFTIREKPLSPETLSRLAKLKEILGLDSDADIFEVIYGSGHVDSKTLAVRTRSVIQIMIALSASVETSQDDIDSGRIPETLAVQQSSKTSSTESKIVSEESIIKTPVMRVHQGKTPPDDTFVDVQYRGRSYWIDDTDWQSKRIFDFLLLILTITESGQADKPQLVISTN